MTAPYPLAGLAGKITIDETLRRTLETALNAARQLPAEALPRLVGGLEEARVTALARLSSPAPTQAADALLTVEEAAQRLSMSRDFLYRHSKEFPFTRRVGRSVRFSALGIEKYIRQKRS